MTSILQRYVTDYNQNILMILFALMTIISIILLVFWFLNRRRFHRLSHQIPASVVKNYLDSIIQNSTSLKSSLFRGGGLDFADGVPSVVPVSGMGDGQQVAVDTASREELNQKNAEIAALKGTITEKEGVIKDLEAQLEAANASAGGDTSALDAQIAEQSSQIEALKQELEDAKNAAPSGGGDDVALESVTKERDELKERLQEYEIIEDDLANLKRLQQENAQLKAELEKGGGSAPAAVEEAPAEESAAEAPAAEEPAAEAPVEEPAVEAPAEEEEASLAAPEEEGEAEEAKADDPALEGEEKSAEDLLSEFEKMLG